MSGTETLPPIKPSPRAMASFIIGLIALLFAGLDFFSSPVSDALPMADWGFITLLTGVVALLMAGWAYQCQEELRLCVVGAAFGLGALCLLISLVLAGLVMLALFGWLIWPFIAT